MNEDMLTEVDADESKYPRSHDCSNAYENDDPVALMSNVPSCNHVIDTALVAVRMWRNDVSA